MLAGERAPVTHDQISGVFHGAAVIGNALCAAQIPIDTRMHAAGTDVTEKRGNAPPVIIDQLLEIAQEIADLFRCDRGILERGPARVLTHDLGVAHATFTQCPDFLLRLDAVIAFDIKLIATLDIVQQTSCLRARFVPAGGAKFDQQPAVAFGQQFRMAPESFFQFVLHQTAIKHFQPDRLILAQARSTIGSSATIGIADHHQHPALRTRNQLALRSQRERAGCLGTDQRRGKIEVMLGQKTIEVVAGDAARYLRVPRTNGFGVVITERLEPGVYLTAPTTLGHDGLHLLG